MSHRQEVMLMSLLPTLLFKCVMISSSNRRFLSSMSSENTKFERVRGGEKSNERGEEWRTLERERNGERWRGERNGECWRGERNGECWRRREQTEEEGGKDEDATDADDGKQGENETTCQMEFSCNSSIHTLTLFCSPSSSFLLPLFLFSFLEGERNLSLSDLFSRIRL